LKTGIEDTIDSDLWNKIEIMLTWAFSTLREITKACGDCPMALKKPANDLSVLFSKIDDENIPHSLR